MGILVKEPGSDCPVPNCPNPPASLGRRRRSSPALDAALQSVEVSSQDVEVVDVVVAPNATLGARLALAPARPACLDQFAVLQLLAAAVLLAFAAAFSLAALCIPRFARKESPPR